MPRRVTLRDLVKLRFAIDGPFNLRSKVEFEVRSYETSAVRIIRVGPGATAKGNLSKKLVVVSAGSETTTYDARYQMELIAIIHDGVRTLEP